MGSSRRRGQRRKPKATTTTTRTRTMLSLSVFLDLFQHPVASSAGNVCKYHDGHVLGELAAEHGTKSRRHTVPSFYRQGRRQCWGLLSSRRTGVDAIAIPRGGSSGWEEQESLQDGEEDSDDESTPTILSSPFLDSFQEEVHDIVGGYRKDVRRIFEQLKEDILQSRGMDQDAIPDTDRKKRNRGPSASRKENGSIGSKSKEEYDEDDELSNSPPVDDDFVMGDTDEEADDVLDRILVEELEEPSTVYKYDESSKKDRFRDNLDNDDGGAIGKLSRTERMPKKKWTKADTKEDEGDEVSERFEKYQAKAEQERSSGIWAQQSRKEDDAMPEEGKVELKAGVPKTGSRHGQHRSRRPQEAERRPYASVSRRRGGLSPRVWKALVVSFTLGGLFLSLGLAFKILSNALGLN